MKTVDQSIELAKLMVSIGTHHGRRVAAMITDMDTPLGRNIGNSLEVMESMEVLKGKGPADLTEVCLQLATNMLVLADKGTPAACRAMAEAVIADGSAFAKCKEMFAAQGGDTRVLDDYSLFEKPAASYELLAEQDGYIVANDAEKIGSASVLLGAGRQKKGDPLDFAAGITLHKKRGDYVHKGESLATFYGAAEKFAAAAEEYRSGLVYGPEKPDEAPLVYALVTKRRCGTVLRDQTKGRAGIFRLCLLCQFCFCTISPLRATASPRRTSPAPACPKNVPDCTHERAGGNHQQTVGYVVHADESGPLVTGDGIVQQSVLVQEPGTQYAFGQHTTQNAHQCRRGTHAEASDAAEQGTEGIKPPETVQVDSTTPFRTQHSSQIAEQ